MADLYDKTEAKGLNINTRPQSIDPIASQRTIFPLEAFEFDDPNRVEKPELRLKKPWVMAMGALTADQLQAAFISTSEIIIGYLGADPENPSCDDRRLIIKAHILTLQHYDCSEWLDDISLGGYDETSKFIPYLMASGMTQNREDVSRIARGLGLPSLVAETQKFDFSNYTADERLGEDHPNVGSTALGTYGGASYFSGVGRTYYYPNTEDAEKFPNWWGV